MDKVEDQINKLFGTPAATDPQTEIREVMGKIKSNMDANASKIDPGIMGPNWSATCEKACEAIMKAEDIPPHFKLVTSLVFALQEETMRVMTDAQRQIVIREMLNGLAEIPDAREMLTPDIEKLRTLLNKS